MKHKIKTEITNDGWTQTMECVFLNEAIAKLVLEDTDTRAYVYGWRIMQPIPKDADKWYDAQPAAKLHQQGKVIAVSCNGKDTYWHKNYEINKLYLEKLAETWKAQADEWLKIHRYHVALLKPILQTLSNDTSMLKRWKKAEMQLREQYTWGADVWTSLNEAAERAYQNKTDIELLGADIKEIEVSVASHDESIKDAFDCLEMDSNAYKDLKECVVSHIRKRFAHFSREKGG